MCGDALSPLHELALATARAPNAPWLAAAPCVTLVLMMPFLATLSEPLSISMALAGGRSTVSVNSPAQSGRSKSTVKKQVPTTRSPGVPMPKSAQLAVGSAAAKASDVRTRRAKRRRCACGSEAVVKAFS
jgi:hypothetical protein